MGSRALVVYPALREASRDPERRLEEAVGLARAIDLKIVHSEWFALNRPVPATLLGGGAVERLGEIIAREEVEVVFVDAQLTPVQQRNLERVWNCKAIDRTGLILEIFGERARTKEGMLQVELAALSYARSRLVRSWTHLERQRGGLGFVGGPGESQLEIDRRLITERMTKLKRQLAQVTRTRALHRKARKRVPFPVVALVGYTNAGKSTLFNRLTSAEVFAKDLLFATLDPTLRQLRLPSGRMIILSDTVGFISDLPTDLVAAFRATLEEVIEADLILHVRDIADPDSDVHKREVNGVLRDLGLESRLEEGVIEVMNKIDLLPSQQAEILINQAERDPRTVVCSAVSGQGTEELLTVIDAYLGQDSELFHLDVDLSDGEALAWLYRRGQVVRREDEALTAHLQVLLKPEDHARFEDRYRKARGERSLRR